MLFLGDWVYNWAYNTLIVMKTTIKPNSKPPKLTKVDLEGKLQRTILKFLKSKGCFVMKTTPGGGVPTGTADIFFCKEGFYGWIEVKKAKNAAHQPGQDQFIAKMDGWSWAAFVWPENWSEISHELEEML